MKWLQINWLNIVNNGLCFSDIDTTTLFKMTSCSKLRTLGNVINAESI